MSYSLVNLDLKFDAFVHRSLYIMPLEIPCQSGLTFVKFSFVPLAQDLVTEKWKKTIFFGRSYEHHPTAKGRFKHILGVRVMLIVEDPTVIVKYRTAIKALFLYFNLCLKCKVG